MTSRPRVLFATLVLSLVLSGCFGGSGKDASPSATLPSDLSPLADAPGAIAGTVTDDTFAVLEGAQVGIVALGLETTTGPDGTFVLESVPTGTHQVVAIKIGHDTSTQAVEVLPGETAQVSLVLPIVIVVQPYNETFIYDGRITCGILLVPFCSVTQDLENVAGTPNPTQDEFAFTWNWDAGTFPLTQVLELVWTPTTTATGQHLSVLYFTAASELESHTIVITDDLPSPIRLEVQQAELEAAKAAYPESEYHYGVYPALAELALDQPFTLYRTDFYGAPAPEGFTALETEA